MTVYDAIMGRRSIRRYKQGIEIPDADIKHILDAAMHAPSAMNSRPWEFAVIKNKELREKIVQISPYARPITEASAAIIVCGLNGGNTKEGFWPQDCGAAIENLLLAAYEMGYGTCWCGLHPVTDRSLAVKELLGLDSIPLAAVAIGVPDETPAMRGYYDETKVHIYE